MDEMKRTKELYEVARDTRLELAEAMHNGNMDEADSLVKNYLWALDEAEKGDGHELRVDKKANSGYRG